ncbi:MAG TPA: DUF4131 domain-containing protein [Clostridiales bacterium]|nr:DUF4131 domain-containing protein [Clostridiales bacterium]
MTELMRRPLPFCFLFFCGGVWLGANETLAAVRFLIAPAVLLTGCVAGRNLICRSSQSSVQTAVCFSVVLLLGALTFWFSEARLSFPEQLEGERVLVSGTVIGVSIKEYSSQLTVKGQIYYPDGEPAAGPETLLLRVSGKSPLVSRELKSNRILFKGVVERPTGPRNPGGFDYARYLKSRQIRMIVSGKTFSLKFAGPGFAPAVRLAVWQAGFAERICRQTGQEVGGMIYGLLFGDKDLLADDLYETFRRNGTAHILAVSGLHVGIVYLCLRRLFAGRAARIRFTAILLILLVYAWLCSFAPSVMRALLMIATHMVAELLHRRYDFLSGIALAGLIILLYNPYYLFHPGFQLSFLAVLTLAVGLPFMENLAIRHLSQTAARCSKPFLPLFVIQAGLIPLTAYQFCYISLAAFWVNLPVVALAGWLLPLAGLAFLMDMFGGPLFGLSATAAGLLARLTIAINEWAAAHSWAACQVVAPPAGCLFLFYAAFFGLTSEAFWRRLRERRWRLLCCWLAAVLLVGAGVGWTVDRAKGRPDVVFVDVGQGDCLHLRMPDGSNVLIDGGGSRSYDVGRRTVLPYLLKNGVGRIDLAIATHLHDDHFAGLVSLCRHMPVERLALFSGNQPDRAWLSGETGLALDRLQFVHRGDSFCFGDDGRIDVLYPAAPLAALPAAPSDPPPVEKAGPAGRLVGNANRSAGSAIGTAGNANQPTGKNLKEADENSNCLVLRVCLKGLTILVTGDVGFPCEQKLLEWGATLSSTVLKVGHHGSRFSTSDAFLQAVQPKLAVISVGRNNFGHPHPDIIEKLTAGDIMTVRTDRSGAVLLTIKADGKTLSLRTFDP